MRTRSSAVERNAALRSALAAAWPTHRFKVRNAERGWAAVEWTDGPSEHDVDRVLAQVRSPDGRPWATHLNRTVSPLLVAVSYLRAHAQGDRDFYRELHPRTGATLPEGSTPLTLALSSCTVLHPGLDAATITEQERLLATVVVAMTPPPPSRKPDAQVRAIARTVAFHAAEINAVML